MKFRDNMGCAARGNKHMVRAKGRHKGGGWGLTGSSICWCQMCGLPSHPIFVWEDDLLDYFDYYFFRWVEIMEPTVEGKQSCTTREV